MAFSVIAKRVAPVFRAGTDYTSGISFTIIARTKILGLSFYWQGGAGVTVRASIWNAAGARLAVANVVVTGVGQFTATFPAALSLTDVSQTYYATTWAVGDSYDPAGIPPGVPFSAGVSTYSPWPIQETNLFVYTNGDAKPTAIDATSAVALVEIIAGTPGPIPPTPPATGFYQNTGKEGQLNLRPVIGGGATRSRVAGKHGGFAMHTVAVGAFVAGIGTGQGTACLVTDNTTEGESATSYSGYCWINADVWVEQSTVFDKTYRNDSTWTAPYVSVGLEVHASGKISFYFCVAGALNEILSATVLTAGVDYFVMCTYDGTNAKLFINGVLDTTLAVTGHLDWGTHGSWIVGGNPNGTIEQRFHGKIQDVTVENVLRDAAFALAIYNAG